MKIFFFLIATIYSAENGACPNADQFCSACNTTTTTQCDSCAYAYVSGGKCVKPTTIIDKCDTYTANGVCIDCEKGFSLGVNKCTAITIGNCLAVVAGKCIACSGGKKPSADGTSCSDTKCASTNCSTCSVIATLEVCVECASGYAFDVSTLACATQKTANCSTQNATNCISCQQGYFWKDKACAATTVQTNSQKIFGLIGTIIFGLLF